jgi:hypothetical protein
VLNPDGGRVCYFAASYADCVAYGSFRGDNEPFGRRLRLTPDNRSLQRTRNTRDNRADWDTALSPTPQNNAGQVVTMATLCGNRELSQGEECDGTLLDGETCRSLGFASGRLACGECHFDTSGCTLCGNDEIDEREECDGTELGDKTCASLGFVEGGTLACADTCKLDTADCGDEFLVPGGGPAGSDCLGEWRLLNHSGRPGNDGKVKLRQRCRDGDPTCDADTTPGTCTWTLGVCFGRVDARLGRCQSRSVERWQLIRPRPDQDAELVGRLAAAVAALGPSTTTGARVAFTPALDASERCTGDVALVVPAGRAVKLVARTAAGGGKPRDNDSLKLVCRR